MNHSKALPLAFIVAILGVGSLVTVNALLAAPSADHGPEYSYKEVLAAPTSQPTPLDASLPSEEELQQVVAGMAKQQATRAQHEPLSAHPEGIEKEYKRLGGENSKLERPLTGIVEAGHGGAKQVYERGMMYWSASTGAHAMYNEFFIKYLLLGGESGLLGLPTTNVEKVGNGARQGFQQATWLYSAQDSGIHYIGGRIHEHWTQRGGAESKYGFPRSDIINVASETSGEFDRAVLFKDDLAILSNSQTGLVSEASLAAAG